MKSRLHTAVDTAIRYLRFAIHLKKRLLTILGSVSRG